jgi:Glycosyltransferase like family
MSVPHASVSVVCVYNDVAVRKQCLDLSIQRLSGEASDVEYLPMDNVSGAFTSAGAALNHGVSLAKNDVVVFVHQDVFLHSLTALKEAAGQMAAGRFGLLGAVGIRPDGRIVGRIRDRVVLLGDDVEQPTDVDSVDEVLFMVPRSQLLRDPLTESPDMAWHAYAVEYGLRIRKRGLRTGVACIPLTHNSLSTNIARLDEAHQAIAERYADLLPLRTTCGVVTSRTAKTGSSPRFASHRWRYRWLRESLALRAVRSAVTPGASVLADIRDDVDDVIDRSPERRLRIVNHSDARRFVDGGPYPLELARRDGNVSIEARDISEVTAVLASRPPGSWLLLTNLSRTDLKKLGSKLSASSSVLGYHTNIGFWLLLGAPLIDLPPQWASKRATSLGTRALVVESGV